jgi:hypothetical protein
VNAHFLTLAPLAAIAATAGVVRSHWLSWVSLGVVVAWSAYMFVLGALLPGERTEMKTIRAQFMVAGIARMCAAAAIGWYVWFAVHYGHSPLWD